MNRINVIGDLNRTNFINSYFERTNPLPPIDQEAAMKYLAEILVEGFLQIECAENNREYGLCEVCRR